MSKRNDEIRIVSFDVEGTLVTTDFSNAIWSQLMPERYARRHGLDFAVAWARVREEYDSVGDQRVEWYDVDYWFRRLNLGPVDLAMEELQHTVSYYPDAKDTLSRLAREYRLSVASGSPRPFLHHLLRDIEHSFDTVFSSTSDYQQAKTAAFYTEMIARLGVEPSQIVHIGDNRQFDFTEPSSIGIQAYHLDRDGTSNDPASLRSLSELADLLDGR